MVQFDGSFLFCCLGWSRSRLNLVAIDLRFIASAFANEADHDFLRRIVDRHHLLFPAVFPRIYELRSISLRHEIEWHLMKNLVVEVDQHTNHPSTFRLKAVPSTGGNLNAIETDECDLFGASYHECDEYASFHSVTKKARPFLIGLLRLRIKRN